MVPERWLQSSYFQNSHQPAFSSSPSIALSAAAVCFSRSCCMEYVLTAKVRPRLTAMKTLNPRTNLKNELYELCIFPCQDYTTPKRPAVVLSDDRLLLLRTEQRLISSKAARHTDPCRSWLGTVPQEQVDSTCADRAVVQRARRDHRLSPTRQGFLSCVGRPASESSFGCRNNVPLIEFRDKRGRFVASIVSLAELFSCLLQRACRASWEDRSS